MKAHSISSSEIKVTWKPPSPGPGTPKGYEVLVNCLYMHVGVHICTFTYSFFLDRVYFFQRHSFLLPGQLLERYGAGRVGQKTQNSEKRNIHGLDRTRGQQSVSHHSKRLQQHRPGSCHCCCHSQDQEGP